jgi:expansin (peptidoglycan-binding protein)
MRRGVLVLAVVGCGGTDGGGITPGGDCQSAPAEASGDGTYYAATGAGNCSFPASPDDLRVAAMNAVDYCTADWCGACVNVTGPQGSVTVRIVDQCPECAQGDLDLSPEAFEMVSPLSAGRIPITWHEVPCDVSGPIAYHFKDGANAYWTAIQIRNHRYPIATVEARDAGGSYTSMPRLEYNFFVEEAGLGPGPYALRVTDTRGHVIEDDGVELGDDVTRTGGAQFPACE